MSLKNQRKQWVRNDEAICFHDATTDDGDDQTSKKYFKEKSSLCKKFIENGECPYKFKCKFAHGSHELRQNNAQNCKYKTKECLTFFTTNQCHYGERCNFLHHHKEDQKKQKNLTLPIMLQEYPELAAILQSRNSSRIIQNVKPAQTE